jgi:hypothetical protein
VALVLQALGSDETLDARSLGVRLGALLLGLHLTADDELADLNRQHFVSTLFGLRLSPTPKCGRRAGEEEIE